MRWLALLLSCAACQAPPTLDPADLACDAPTSAADHPDADSLTSIVEGWVEAGLPGVQLSVDRPGVGALHLAAGEADLGAGIPLSPCHLTRAGSINKMVNAVVVLQLVDEGRMALDAPLTDYLEADTARGIANADQATVRQALQHGSGMPNWIQSLAFQTASLDDLEREWAADELLAFARHMPAAFPTGSQVAYSNTNTLLLGLAVEQVTGSPLAHVYDDRVFAPLDLTKTRFAAPDPIPSDLVRGYVDLRNDGRLMDSTTYSGWDVHADGGLLSNAAELTALVRAVTDGTLLSPDRLADLQSTRAPKHEDASFFPIAYGMGVFRMETEQGTWWFHSGDAIGYWATVLIREEDGLALSWAVNGNYGTLDSLFSSREAYTEVFEALGDVKEGAAVSGG